MNSAAFISWNIGGEVPAIHTRLQADPSEGHATETTGEGGPHEAGKLSGTCTIYLYSQLLHAQETSGEIQAEIQPKLGQAASNH